MIRPTACVAAIASVAAFATLPVSVAVAGADGASEEPDHGSSTEQAEDDTEGGEEQDEELSEDEREAWKNRKRRAAQVAIRDAAGPGGWLERSWTWDLTFDVGLRLLGEAEGWTFQGRSGITRISEPGAYTAGVTAQVDTDGRPVLGLEVEVLSLNLGTYGRLGGGLTLHGAPRWSAGLGWQVFGVEAVYEPRRSAGGRWTGLAELRVPVSWIARAVHQATGRK